MAKRPTSIRRFESAQVTKTLSSWIINSIQDFNEELRSDIKTLRARSRDASLNDVYARRYFKAITTQTIGSIGINLKMGIRNSNGTPDTFANMLIEERWARFSKSVTTDGRSLREALKLYLETTARDGEVFVVIRRGEEFGKYKMALQFYEAEYCDLDYNGTVSDGNEVRSGIEYNSAGKPVAYYFWKYHPEARRSKMLTNER
jgi:capsid protein